LLLRLIRAGVGGVAFVARNCRDVFAALDMGQSHPEPENATASPYASRVGHSGLSLGVKYD